VKGARAAGLPFVTSAELGRRLTAAKKTRERAWLGEVSSVVLQQSPRDLDAAYRNFFDGPKPLHVRVWTCGACGIVLDRDVNPAVNVAQAAGLAVSACGARL
jgi:transposase